MDWLQGLRLVRLLQAPEVTVTKTIEDLTADAEWAEGMVAYWIAARDYHEAEKAKAHIEYIKALEDNTRAQNALLAFHGASS